MSAWARWHVGAGSQGVTGAWLPRQPALHPRKEKCRLPDQADPVDEVDEATDGDATSKRGCASLDKPKFVWLTAKPVDCNQLIQTRRSRTSRVDASGK